MTVEEYSKQGYEQLEKEDYEKAFTNFQRAVAKEATHTPSLYGLARAHFKLENYEDSIEVFDRLVNLLPNNATYLSERGVALHWTGDNQLALEDFDRAVEIEPENPYRYSSRAYIKDRLQDYEGSIEDYSKAIELDPEDAISYNNRGLVEEKLGYKQKAQNSYQRADELDKKINGDVDVSEDNLTSQVPQPTGITENELTPPAKKQSRSPLWSEIRSVFTSRNQFKEFVQFVNPFNKK